MRGRLFASATLAVAVLATGCGSSETTTKTSAEQWASGVCGAVTSYVQALKQAAGTFKSNPTSAGLDQARAQASSTTESFKATLGGLGRPDTASGKQAKQAVDSLASLSYTHSANEQNHETLNHARVEPIRCAAGGRQADPVRQRDVGESENQRRGQGPT